MGALDRDALLWVVEHRVGWLDPVFVGLSVLGAAGLVWIALAPALAALRGRPALRALVVTAATVWSADVTTSLLKVLVDRARPPVALPQVDPLVGGTVGSSFPSGHAATSAAGMICLSLLVPRALPALAALAAAVAFSRVYVGVHYPGDVIVGFLVGTAFGLALVVLTSDRLRPTRLQGLSSWLRGSMREGSRGP